MNEPLENKGHPRTPPQKYPLIPDTGHAGFWKKHAWLNEDLRGFRSFIEFPLSSIFAQGHKRVIPFSPHQRV
jgi:hypothetical protein